MISHIQNMKSSSYSCGVP